ncbi:MAG: hypothetical protein WAW39_07565 [Prosthecobacter sp.]|uniref:hypothetical protein n=1 Tax=Prosthecobacter sp. TaxID=1965333 RepID=UPI003BB1B333
MSHSFKQLRLLFVLLLAITAPLRSQSDDFQKNRSPSPSLPAITVPLRPQPTKEMAALEKRNLAETLRLAASNSPEDRLHALTRLYELHDMAYYDLLWKLMNDSDIEVRIAAIGLVEQYYNFKPEGPNLPKELVQKMASMLEKEVTPERIAATFAPGKVKLLPASLVITSAVSLNHLYRYHHFSGSMDDYRAWQQSTVQPLAVLLATRIGDIPPVLFYHQIDLLNAITDPAVLMELLSVTLKSMDSPDFPAEGLQQALIHLWCNHRMLGKDEPLNLMLVAQLSPRLERLAQRIRGAIRDPSNKAYAEQLINEITAAVAAAREQLAAPAPKAADEKAR